MAKEKNYLAMFEGFEQTEIRLKMKEYLDKCIQDRTKIVMGLGVGGGAGMDFDKPYSYHDTIRGEIRFIELVMKNLPDTIIKQERARILQEEAEEQSKIQAQVDALADMSL